VGDARYAQFLNQSNGVAKAQTAKWFLCLWANRHRWQIRIEGRAKSRLYMVGKKSPQSALGVARLLTVALLRVEVVEFDGLGHIGPITHPQQVNKVTARFLASQRHA